MFGASRGRMEASLFIVLAVLCFALTTTVSSSNETKAENSSTPSSNSSPPTRGSKTQNARCKNMTGDNACQKCMQGYTGKQCEKCANGWYGNLTNPNDTCKQCNCSGNLDLQQIDSCHPVTGLCQKCLPNTSGSYCEKCTKGYHGDARIAKNCTPDVPNISHHHKKELVIIIVCSVLAAICLVGIATFLFLHFRKRRCRKEGGTFWKVELSNRNYDNLDFSLLDPVTDTPLVFRADIAGFDEDALLASEKPQLILEADDVIG